jgi:hypothetical protein
MMTPKDQETAREAKAIVALAFRNGPIENLHAGKLCPTCAGQSGYSHVTDDQMKTIMKSAVNRIYALLRLKSGDPVGYSAQIEFGARYTAAWDDPEEPADRTGLTLFRAEPPPVSE